MKKLMAELEAAVGLPKGALKEEAARSGGDGLWGSDEEEEGEGVRGGEVSV